MTSASIDLYAAATPNGWKVTILLEELGLNYNYFPVRLGEGEQFTESFRRLNPNGRIPVLVDRKPISGQSLTVFESGAILLYLAEKEGRFLPGELSGRYAVVQWLMWQMSGLGPMAGQNGHFLLYAPERIPYAVARYGDEVRRLYGVLDRRLTETGGYIVDEYSIADMACFPWIMTHKKQGLTLDDYPGLKRWFGELRSRPAVQRGLAAGGGIDAMRNNRMSEQDKARLYRWRERENEA